MTKEMKRSLFFACILQFTVALFAQTSNTTISVVFDSANGTFKNPSPVAPLCRVTIGKDESVFAYSGDSHLAETILGKVKAGQPVELSVSGYSSGGDVIRLLARLNLAGVFAFPGEMKGQTWSFSNHLQAGDLDRLAIYPYAEPRARYRCACHQSVRSFCRHGHEGNPAVSNESVFNGYASRSHCISNALAHGIAVVESGMSVFFPELDCLVVCGRTDAEKILAACHFTGGDRFPFEGCGRGLPVAMKDIAQVDFATIKHEVLLERELGPGFIGASDAELASRILDSPQKDRALELIHTDIAENKFGRWSLLGRTWGMIAGDDNSKRKECLFDVFASGDRKLIVMAHERRALCVWMILDDLFWGQASITGSAKP